MIHLERRCLLLFLCAFFLLMAMPPVSCKAQSRKDSAIRIIEQLSSRYRKKTITQQQYLDTLHNTMQLLQSQSVIFSSKELLGLLATYREIIWKDENLDHLKQAYYALLGNQALKAGRNGEMLYYAERLSELEQQSNRSASIAALTLIANYYNGKLNFTKTRALYQKHRSFIAGLPGRIRQQQDDRKELMRSGDLLSYLADAACEIRDSLMTQEIAALVTQLTANAADIYQDDKEMLARFRYSRILSDYTRHMAMNDRDAAWNNIRQLDTLFTDAGTPEYLKTYIGFMIADKKVLLYLEDQINDSADHYINRLRSTYANKLSGSNVYMVKKYVARLLYNRGLFRQSEDTLIRALELLEQNNAQTLTEIDEVLYALTQVEEQQYLLADSERKQKQSDRNLLLLGSGAFILLSGSGLAFGVIRRRQKTRFIDFKLNLARNIHDETNPALLYAKMLARKQHPDDTGLKSALEAHIELTMEHIRSLSHDLKSDQQLLLGDLLRDTQLSLEKMSALADFTYSLTHRINKKRFLSHFQYHNLKAILQECISNSIKHATFRQVRLSFVTEGNSLRISYSDDGQGWPEDQALQGIGLQNIQERAEKINSHIRISNNYPEGYLIELSLKLS